MIKGRILWHGNPCCLLIWSKTIALAGFYPDIWYNICRVFNKRHLFPLQISKNLTDKIPEALIKQCFRDFFMPVCPQMALFVLRALFLRVISERFYLILPDSGSVGRKDRAVYSIR